MTAEQKNILALKGIVEMQGNRIIELQNKLLIAERAIGTLNNQVQTINQNFALAVAENRHDVHRR